MSSSSHYDVIVVGGGPAGMMAAGRAASRGLKVVLIEKNKMLGKKLSITGGGRCNILNAETDTRTLLSHYGPAAKFLHSAFAQHGMKDSYDFFESRNVPLVVEARKRAFPKSQSAPDVTACMQQYLTSQNVELRRGKKVKEVRMEAGKVSGIVVGDELLTADSYILATGGAARTDTGSTGDGFSWLRTLGHTVHASNPNIVPLKVEESWVHALSGTSLSFAKITFGTDRSKSEGKFSKTGKILFTHFGLSAPLILNSAYEVKQLLEKGPVEASIDLFPDTDEGVLRKRLLALFQDNPNKLCRTLVKDIAPNGLGDTIASMLPRELLDEAAHSVTKPARDAIASLMKALPLTITDTMGMEWAVVSDGGVDLAEVDTKTMRSKKLENLFITGDLLHVNRPSGGYSLQLCWTTGWVAGSHC